MTQGKISIQANEHLCKSDGAIALYRVQLRKGIRAVQEGKDPKGIVRGAHAPIQTYANNMFEAGNAGVLEGEAKQKMLFDFGQRAMKRTLACEFDPEQRSAEAAGAGV